MSETIKFTVIVPTRERADTLYHCLRTIVAQEYDNLAIVVSDNFSQDNTREVVESFADPRIKYINTGRRISMSHNWEHALNCVTDGWVTIVGDDDGLLPGALQTVAGVIESTGCEAVASKRCLYNWPTLETDGNQLTIPMTAGIESRSARAWLEKLMRGDTIFQELPCLYTGGFADVAAINRARGPDGGFFQSMTPDVYSAVALASVMDTYVMLNEAVVVGGTSGHSGGYSFFEMGSNLRPAQQFFSEANIPIHKMLAGGEAIKSLPLWIYESYLQSAHLHRNFLQLKLEDQLGLALSRVAPRHYADARKHCSQVALDNGLSLPVLDRAVKQAKRRMFVQQIKRIPDYISGQMIISADEFGVRDVYGAAQLVRSVLRLETPHAHWRMRNLSRLLKKLNLF